MIRKIHRMAAAALAVGLLQGAWSATAAASAQTAHQAGGSVPAAYTTTGPVSAYISAATTANGDGRYTDYAIGAIPQAISQTSPSVVAIIGRQAGSSGPAGRFDLTHGTGVIVESGGTIITNAHVVKNMDQIVVVTFDGKQYNGKTTHFDEESDLALVHIDAAGLKEAAFAAKADIQVGETVIAIGTPISFSLRNSVTVGVISGLDRSVNSTYRLLQTDAAINPGNSGGALVNLKGEVVGINTLKYADYGVDNLGFAIPADTVQYVLQHFRDYGRVKRPATGMELEESWAALVGIPTEEPMTVSFVEPDSPAAKAGIKPGDKFLKLGDHPAANLVEFNELLKNYLPGESAEFTLQTAGGTVKRTVVFGELAGAALPGGKAGSGGAFDSDQGKTRIGDSRFGWSMKYPSGLELYHQSETGGSVSLADARGEYSLRITAEEKEHEYSKSGLLKALASQEEDVTILERQYVTAGGQSYARIISRDSYGYYESRAYSGEDYICYVVMSIYEEKNYKNTIKRSGYTDLLDSFRLSFDKQDAALKDVAVNQDGYRKHAHEDYGYSLSVPAGWSSTGMADEFKYEDDSYTSYAQVEMTTLAEGDTVEKWVRRTEERYAYRYAPAYLETGKTESVVVAGRPASLWTAQIRQGEEWSTLLLFFLEKEGYKYRLTISHPRDLPSADAEDLVERITRSFELGLSARNDALGLIEDEEDLVDYTSKIKFTNKKLGYSAEIPEYWEPGAFPGVSQLGIPDGDQQIFLFPGGFFNITAARDEAYGQAVKQVDQLYKKVQESGSELVVDKEEEEMFGVDATKFTVENNSKTAPSRLTQYIFSKQDITYLVSWNLEESARTEQHLADLEQAVSSLRFKGE
ncbi:MAG: trypsin [Paenibacillaceae bacterium]|jgi:S1-C subfamily serine protease|nr:trypsin [Paenibacillaceae bacterium]